MAVLWLLVMVIFSCQTLSQTMAATPAAAPKDKRTIELQTAYVYRKASQRSPHYSVILGSSGKTVQGPELLPVDGDEVHRVQGFVVNTDEIETEETTSFGKSGLQVQNRYRMLHNVPPLTWSDGLARQAEKVAYDLAKHSSSSKRSQLATETVGENVERFYSVNYGCDSKAALEAVGKWYKEGDDFSYAYPHLSDKTNSFTQMIWKGSKKVGMGCALKKGLLTNDVYVVALYSPPGNVKDEVVYNVIRSGHITPQKDDVYSNIF